jgi:hypothetical protein
LNKLYIHSTLFILLLIGMAVLLAGCKPGAETEESMIIAQVGDKQLRLDYAISRISEQQMLQDSASAINQYRQQWIRKRVLADEAERMGIKETETFKSALDRFSDELAIQFMFNKIQSEIVTEPATMEEAVNFYGLNRENFVLNERHVRFHHMITDNINDANRARNELLRGEPWQEIAERYASDLSYSIRNSNVFHPVSQALREYPAMAQFIRVIGVTEVSQIRQIDSSFHFVQLLEDRPSGEVPNSDWAFDRIQEWLTLDKKRKHLNAFEQNLIRRAEANREIKIFD